MPAGEKVKPRQTATPKQGKRNPFTSADEVLAALRAQNVDEVTEALVTLRNQLTLRNEEAVVSPDDGRLLLVQRWLERAPGLHNLFSLWESVGPRQTPLLTLIISVILAVLKLTSFHYTHHASGATTLKSIMKPHNIRRLNSYIAGSHNDLILVTLKLLLCLSTFSHGKEKKAVLESFAWETKSLPRLLNMRRKTKGDGHVDLLIRLDIRTAWILFLLSFVEPGTPSQIKTAFLEQHRDAFLPIFKGLTQDPANVVRKILEVCWAGIWSDQKIKRTLKIGFFAENTVAHITKLYERNTPENTESDFITADVAHHFLLAICTRPGTGICFQERGWYPREADSPEVLDDGEKPKTGRIYNKILANILKALKVNEDPRQQELALKIMAACPELVAGYWAGAALTLEPRLSSRWITNVAFLGMVVSLPIPISSFFLRGTNQHQPTPPPISIIMDNILPSVHTKNFISKGLQSPSGLVRHCAALVLIKSLRKYDLVRRFFLQIASTLDENEETGQWFKRLRDLEKEARRRVPDFQVIVAFSQRHSEQNGPLGNNGVETNPTKNALLSESSQRLLMMYHRCLPVLVTEARFDVGKLLLSFSDTTISLPGAEGESVEKLRDVGRLHVLQLLKDSEQFFWSGKSGSKTYVHVLLETLTTSRISSTRQAVSSLLQHVFSRSLLFQEDPSEASLWLSSLPRLPRAENARSPDGAPLTDEATTVVVFLDDCIQRCLKTPYRYIEELFKLLPNTAQSALDHGVYPSPLLMTVLEQLAAKHSSKMLTPSDLLALTTFIRKLVTMMVGQQSDLEFLKRFIAKVDEILKPDSLPKEYSVMKLAIRREVGIMSASFPTFKNKQSHAYSTTSEDTNAFLTEMEATPTPDTTHACSIFASQIVDWVRLIDFPLFVDAIRRVVALVIRVFPPAIRDLHEHLDPSEKTLWDGFDITTRFSTIARHVSFIQFFLQAEETHIIDEKCRDTLLSLAVTGRPTLAEIRRNLRLITHGIATTAERPDACGGLLLLVSSILERAAGVLQASDLLILKEDVFQLDGPIKRLLLRDDISSPVRTGIETLVKVTLRTDSEEDRRLVSSVTAHWLHDLQSLKDPSGASTIDLPSLWIPFVSPEDLFGLLGFIWSTDSSASSITLPEILDATLHSLNEVVTSNPSWEELLRTKIPTLISLRPLVNTLQTLDALISIAVESSLPLGYDGHPSSAKPDLSTLVKRSQARLHQKAVDLPDISQFISQSTSSPTTINILCGMIYHRAVDPPQALSWLNENEHSCEHIVRVVHAVLDVASARGDDLPEAAISVIRSLIPTLVQSIRDPGRETRSLASSTCFMILTSIPTLIQETVEHLVNEARLAPVTLELLELGVRLSSGSSSDFGAFLNTLIDVALEWALKQIGNDNFDTGVQSAVRKLDSLIRLAKIAKGHLAETLLAVVTQQHLQRSFLVELSTTVVKAVQLKPLVVNRQLQNIIQHSHFFKLAAPTSPCRDAIVSLLYVLFNLHPNNTCQPSHMEPLIRIYEGTLGDSDRKILSLFHLFEEQRKTSVASLVSSWSSHHVISPTALDAIESLDTILILRTSLGFPRWRRLEDGMMWKADSNDSQLYDPVFLILLFSQMLSESPPSMAIGWVGLFRTNIVCVLIRALSCKDGRIRNVALCQLSALWTILQNADMQEKPHVLHVLKLLKNTFPPPNSQEPYQHPRRLPTYTTLLLLHALRGIFYPSNFIYPLTARFLLQRPELDVTDVPMLYNMLYSSDAEDWKKERGWIIRFLADGMRSTDDWMVFKRRHTWDLLAGLFQSSEADIPTRNAILEVLVNLTCIQSATTSLILKSGLLTWIEMQLHNSKSHIAEWIKILDNIMVIVDSAKIESATEGQWREVICRCLLLALENLKSETDANTFSLAVRAALRLSLLHPNTPFGLPGLLSRLVALLEEFESGISDTQFAVDTISPHHTLWTSYTLHQEPKSPTDADPLKSWMDAVESLWRISMTLEAKLQSWDGLTSRLLVSRYLAGPTTSVGEWVRAQSISNLA